MKKKLLPAVVITVGIFIAAATTCAFAGYYLSGTMGEGMALIPSPSPGTSCSGEIKASQYLANTGDTVVVTLKAGGSPTDFVGRAKAHNQKAKYYYEGVYRYIIVADGKDYLTDSAELVFNEPGDYVVDGYITFRWEVSKRKTAAGFARYYYSTRHVECIIRVTEMEDSDAGNTEEPKQPEKDDDTEETIEPALCGMVEHTPQWETNREYFNARCQKEGEGAWCHDENTYFSGEKFVLSAAAEGENLPSSVSVKIEGTDYETRLQMNHGGGEYIGALFEPAMIDRFGSDKPETLTFVFTAYIDGTICQDRKQITMDNRRAYWLMHRKE